jgi:hypothetical protein
MTKEKLYKIKDNYYLNPYIAICIDCDLTFKTEEQALKHGRKADHNIHWCQEALKEI